MIKIAIADDHKLFREGMGMILDSIPDFELLYHVEDGSVLMDKLADEGLDKPNVILLDLKMPKKDGLETLKELTPQYPGIKVLILTMLDEDDYILHSLDQGAHGYLLKDTSADEMKSAIEGVWEQGFYFSQRVSQVMLKGLRMKSQPSQPSGSSALSKRELEILQLICQELTMTDIAEKLFLSARTVESHRKNIMDKLGAKNTAGLVFRALKAGLIA